jgi:hypothetical protein
MTLVVECERKSNHQNLLLLQCTSAELCCTVDCNSTLIESFEHCSFNHIQVQSDIQPREAAL